MGATNNIKGTNITLKLADLACSQCSQKFTEQEIKDRNWDIWFDTSNDVQLEPLAKGYYFSIWIRSIEHQEGNCPETYPCEGCRERFLEKEMKYIEYSEENHNGDEWWCPNCWKVKEKDHE